MGDLSLRAFVLLTLLLLGPASAAEGLRSEQPVSTFLTIEIVERGQLPVNQPVEILEVPEPSSFLLLIPAGLLALYRRR